MAPLFKHSVRGGPSGIYLEDAKALVPATTGNSTGVWVGGFRYEISGANLTQTGIGCDAFHGTYNITGTNAGTFPKSAIVGEVHDGTSTADAAVAAVIGGDGGTTTTATAAFGVFSLNSTPGNKFAFGLSLGDNAGIGSFGAVTYSSADIRFSSGAYLVAMTSAVTANTTTTTAPAGSLGITTNATGKTKLFISDGSKWQFAQVS